ncbi:phosphoesterase [Halobacteriales archaeon SW_7_65_23]|nr:MAG: phosphoesterase [Halobacteriales archaeon SW_7_65_23]
MGVEPVHGRPAATATADGERLLVIADYHAGIEAVLQSDGVELESRGGERRDRLLDLLAETDAERLVVLGDLSHAIGEPWDAERTELAALFGALDVPVTLVKGNHDGVVEELLSDLDHDVTVTDSGGIRLGDIGFAHGHTWPSEGVLAADTLCVGHEHPTVRLEDEVGGRRFERVWLRGGLDPAPFKAHHGDPVGATGMVVVPAFNDLSGGTWVNAPDTDFLSPFLPDALPDGEAYLLDGTRLGPYRTLHS